MLDGISMCDFGAGKKYMKVLCEVSSSFILFPVVYIFIQEYLCVKYMFNFSSSKRLDDFILQFCTTGWCSHVGGTISVGKGSGVARQTL
jgi:hypothetical protein